tara:strand:- start:167 stop:847 length:681 start_codon:yes stop_codon:yes gene_type:complete
MALIKMGAWIVDVRGKIGGTVFTKGRSGAVARNKVTPVNPRTTRQSAVRAALGALSQAWRTLSQAQRDSWNAAVSSFSRTNIFGDSVNPTGKNLYVGLNTNLEKVSGTAITVPPTPAEITAPIITSMNVAVLPSIMNFVVTNTSAGQKLFIQGSPSVSAGITNISSKIALISVEPQTAGTVDIWASYVAVFGTPVVGQKIFLRVSGVNVTTGQTSTPEILSYIVSA